MYVYGCQGIEYHYLNIPPNCVYIRYLCLEQAPSRVGLALGVSELRCIYIYIYIYSNLYITTTQVTNKKWPLWTGGLYMEVPKYSTIP